MTSSYFSIFSPHRCLSTKARRGNSSMCGTRSALLLVRFGVSVCVVASLRFSFSSRHGGRKCARNSCDFIFDFSHTFGGTGAHRQPLAKAQQQRHCLRLSPSFRSIVACLSGGHESRLPLSRPRSKCDLIGCVEFI